MKIGIIGDYNPENWSHRALDAAPRHAAGALGVEVDLRWIPTPAGLDPGTLEGYDALFAAPASPYRSMDGMLAGIQYARLRGVPFLGVCGGFQHTLIEYARHVLGLADADSAENAESGHAVISPVACPMPDRRPGAPKLAGRSRLRFRAGSLLAGIYGAAEAEEEYFCNFEVNPDYRAAFEGAGLRFSAFGEHGEPRALELPGHRFYLATLFQPQLRSSESAPHPLLVAWLRAAA